MSGLQLFYVDDLTPAKDFWDLKGKIIRVWRQSFRSDFILLDERGSKIQGCVKNRLYQDFAETLKEDNVVVIRKCGVGLQMDKHRVIALDHKINLFKCTSMDVVTGFSGDPYGFHFSKFSDLLNLKLTPPLSVDAIGKVGYCGNLDIFRTNGKEHKRLNFDIEDLDGVVLRVTLWSDFAVDFNKFVSSFDGNQIVVVIQHGRIKPFNGSRTLQNDMFATRIFINPDFEEAKSFLSSFIEKNGITSSSTVLSSQTVYPLHNEFLVRTKQKHIQELNEIDEPMECIVVATIKMVEEGAGWCYNACRRCQKKAVNKTDYLEQADEIPEYFIDAPVDSQWCIKCKSFANSLVPKYKIQVSVKDSTGEVSFVMFDNEVQKLVGLHAVDIRQRQMQSGDKESFPCELKVLKEKVLAFKIGVSKFNLLRKYNIYAVRKVCDDPEVIAELQNPDRADEASQDETGNLTGEVSNYSLSQFDSKESVSYTDDSLTGEPLTDFNSTQSGKILYVPGDDGLNDDQGSSTRSVKSKIQP